MTRARHVVLTAIAVVFAAAPAGPSTVTTREDRAALGAVADAERSFAQTAIREGQKDAFIAWLSDSAVIFRPLPMNGKQWWKNRDKVNSTLEWEPQFVEVSRAGDLGLSTGPWRLSPAAESGNPPLYGQFLTMWRLQEGGLWRVETDIGIVHPQPWRGVGTSELQAGPVHPEPKTDGKPVDLARLDDRIANASPRGLGKAYRAMATKDVHFLRQGRFRFDRPSDMQVALDSLGGRYEFHVQGQGVAKSADFGYTYGTAERWVAGSRTPADSSLYFHVWRREPKEWKLSFGLLNPL